jgi:hypothetical protein
MKTFATLIAVALALVLQGGFAGAFASTTSTGGHCTAMTVTDYVSSYAHNETHSNAWANVNDGLLSFTTANTGCVIITFSATAFIVTPGGTSMHVRTLMDGNQLCVPAPYKDILSTVPDSVATSITRICKNVAPGTHTVQVQYSGDEESGFTVGFVSHVLTVTHN